MAGVAMAWSARNTGRGPNIMFTFRRTKLP
jgi:hypothetical protein